MKKRLLASLAAIILIAILLPVILFRADDLPDQTAYKRFGTGGGTSYGQVSVFDKDGMSESDCRRNTDTLIEKTETEVTGIGGDVATSAFSSAPMSMTFVSQSDLGERNANLNTFFTAGDFFLFHPYEIKSGNYLNADTIMHDNAVLDEFAAWDLFGSNDIVGEIIYCNNIPVHISGVVKADESGIGTIYLDSELALALTGQEAIFNCFEIILPSPVPGSGFEAVKSTIGISEGDVSIDKATRVVDNGGRERLGSLFKLLSELPDLAVKDDAIILPPWENRARTHAVKTALLLVPLCLLMLIPVYTFIYLIYRFVEAKSRIWKRLKKAVSRLFSRMKRRKAVDEV
jgi:hypothetical protein